MHEAPKLAHSSHLLDEMSLTNPPTGPNANAVSRGQSLKRSVQDAFAGTYVEADSLGLWCSYLIFVVLSELARLFGPGSPLLAVQCSALPMLWRSASKG